MSLKTPIPVKLYNFQPDIWDKVIPPKHLTNNQSKQLQVESLKDKKSKTYDHPKDIWKVPSGKARLPNASIFGNPSKEVDKDLNKYLRTTAPVVAKGAYNHTALKDMKTITDEEFYKNNNLHNDKKPQANASKKVSGKIPNQKYMGETPEEVISRHKKRPVSAVGYNYTKDKQGQKNENNKEYLIEITKTNIKKDQ